MNKISGPVQTEADIKRQVRDFYDQVGWQQVGEDVYQNAHYEDLRPVAREYIHRCHRRVLRHLKPTGRLLLDAGSGPIQYPEYLEYSRGYQRRVCADISIVALREARKRIGEHGLFVVADIANLPFKPEAFDGVVSLHTIHHLPEDQHLQAYRELYRVLSSESNAVVVNGWPESKLMNAFEPLVRLSNRLRSTWRRLRLGRVGRLLLRSSGQIADSAATSRRGHIENGKQKKGGTPKGTFTSRHGVVWVREVVGDLMPVEIRVWRSASVRFMRALIHPYLAGRLWLRLLFALEERFPRYFGENGQYPLVIVRKTAVHKAAVRKTAVPKAAVRKTAARKAVTRKA